MKKRSGRSIIRHWGIAHYAKAFAEGVMALDLVHDQHVVGDIHECAERSLQGYINTDHPVDAEKTFPIAKAAQDMIAHYRTLANTDAGFLRHPLERIFIAAQTGESKGQAAFETYCKRSMDGLAMEERPFFRFGVDALQEAMTFPPMPSRKRVLTTWMEL